MIWQTDFQKIMVRGENMKIEILMDPEKYGYEVCDHCNGYGSSFQDPNDVDRCSKCGGSGLVKKEESP